MGDLWIRRSSVLIGLLACLATTPIHAVVVSSTTGNTARPDDDPGWDNVGILRGSTAIYLGNRWAMTAAHVGVAGAADITFPEFGTFEIDKKSIVRLENPPRPRLSDMTDIELFQLLEDPGIPPLPIATEHPPIGTPVVVIGRGRDRELNQSYWEASGRNWQESEPPGDYSGFKTLSAHSLRWGTNLLEEDELFENERDGDITTIVETIRDHDVISLITEFDYDDGNSDETVTHNGDFMTQYESQAVLNDSGGALFFKNGDAWELLGMAVAVDGFTGQPDPAVTAIFGNVSYYADLVTYGDQIVSRLVYGDFDGDGMLSAIDIDLMTLATVSGEYDGRFDLNRDGLIDLDDRAAWVIDLAGTYFGDANLDGQFDSTDLVAVLQAAQYEDDEALNSTWGTGDWNGDLEFTTGDLVTALQSGGYEQGPRLPIGEGGAVAVVPEPNAVTQLFLALVLLCSLCLRHFRIADKESRLKFQRPGPNSTLS